MTASLHTLSSGRDAGRYYINDPNQEARPKSRDEYYAQDGGGFWWSTGETIVKHGAPVDRGTFSDLCAGIDPRSGMPLVRGAGAAHRAGWDLTFSSPKSLSVLWMAGNEQQRSMLHNIHRAAVNDALEFLAQEHLVEVRLGAGGKIRQIPTDIIIGCFDHFTSREGDGNIHTHCVLLNTGATIQDRGSARHEHFTLEPRKLFEHQLLLGAVYRAACAERLKHGFRLREAGRNQFEIAGIPECLLEAFSKRANQIEQRVGRDASGAQKELAALATRAAKDEIPVGELLEQRWREELNRMGINPWQAALDFVPNKEADAVTEFYFDPPEIAGNTPIAVAASKHFRHQSVISRKDLLLDAFVEASRAGIDIDQVWTELRSCEDRKALCRLAGDERGECWTTPSIAATEAELLRAADRPNERDWFVPAAVEAAIASEPHLSEEQAQAIRVATNRDGVSVCDAPAGSGKTTLTRTLVEAARLSGVQHIIGLAPSWVAADELSKSCGISACSIAKWRHDRASCVVSPDLAEGSLVIIDEVGMTGIADVAAVISAARQGAKIVCLGDRRQLESVQGGGALRAIVEVVARSAVLSQVRRQKVDWQRAASIVMAKGDSSAGLRAYAKNERLELVSGDSAAQSRVVQIWSEYRKAYGEDVLIITRKNSDVAILNRAARAVLRSEGRLHGPEIMLSVIARDKKVRLVGFSQGDRIRFGENLPQFRVRNGTRGTIERMEVHSAEAKISVRLEDGRLIEENWAALARQHPKRSPAAPRISHSYAGTAYSVQGRTAAAAVLYLATRTDARLTYVGLTRHLFDARIVAERDRLEAAVRQRQRDIRLVPSNSAIRERLFDEATTYAEKANVADYVEDRVEFIRTGRVEIQRRTHSLNLGRVVRASQRLVQATWDRSADRPFVVSIWRLFDRVKHVHREISERLAEVVQAFKAGREYRVMQRGPSRDWDLGR